MFSLLITVVGILAVDQVSKWVAIEFLKPEASIPVIRNFFHFTYVENTGIAFGLLQEHSGFLLIFISLSVLAILAFASYFTRREIFIKRIAYGFILGGAIGNLTDRIRFGYVVDFLDFRIWPVFNLADSFITIGVCLFLWLAFRGR
ncbi:MAG: signal peptidase II [Omnitrophica bacterium RIFCSPLOWO2_12_FULL_44_17]|uniref:Lipoprotein signal peptidase n=1 Tax=Candidatus Danuiimicrobium aquiferis TaxID=1801832 RepID=A0A1G1KRT0_9BACT|nr:MAG: signal peptidase II [Omnitrophica bacterium RIFCSPHIGHO2_02_FULL_45_28]OGW91235.1 MAG: signal peptidase II [Omnitrophica bacterium RIFCSPHIGHO2_12_FULL_44_12]OGW95636.1 MAG: signal peptidase II [Omnitrophica bacterium RIFCSPLOWO2_12_FULL_44_17]OGX03651.1 MAG: signal peptidase II [Omnitrophica bacterium RIFCSPLOWO2_02_FULL_44_11]